MARDPHALHDRRIARRRGALGERELDLLLVLLAVALVALGLLLLLRPASGG